MATYDFYNKVTEICTKLEFLTYFFAWCIFLLYLVYILGTTLKKNWRLLMLVITMFINATASLLEVMGLK